MKNYSKEVVDKIQQMINSRCYEISNIKSFDELPQTIYVNGVKVQKAINPAGRQYLMTSMDYGFNTEDFIEWKKEAIYRFFVKDYKKMINDVESELYKDYYELYIIMHEYIIVALFKKIDDLELTEEDFNYYNEIAINDSHYAIIKMYIKEFEGYNVRSTLEEQTFFERIYDSYGSSYKIDEDYASQQVDTSDDNEDEYDDMYPESEELF
jgi:hypothetical protein